MGLQRCWVLSSPSLPRPVASPSANCPGQEAPLASFPRLWWFPAPPPHGSPRALGLPRPCRVALRPSAWVPHRGAVTTHSAASTPGYLLFRDFALNQAEEAKPLMEFYEEVRWGAGAGVSCDVPGGDDAPHAWR